ncbi:MULTISPECIES: indole-3-glycerol phosphate synthase TrpC [Planococcus]|uniref:Indole-3-glycerol phosphate synthase n=1 Tax=Planococcus faecalis TaxID=1598147 RepID=A0ABN4XHK9_9BACL|nr:MULTISPECIES: indole-3-glycerol phosphate synthase TrpC [Planococcus]AQU78225.1 indole-3-glycerol phosphate synthase [Planococcus faecalis]MDJ0331137.1 indole-3-glycerol phosphate synthase TrpC [Planococcus sp. S3-L1]OHX53814.1 indole-3-glycerol phosphate synthase [Planococcus faecalis]
MTILDDIIATKYEEVKMYKPVGPNTIDFPEKTTLLGHLQERNGVISEIKRASPSKGDIKVEVDIVAQAKKYEEAGAAAISVLTDEVYFKGSIDDLCEVAKVVSIPVLCKDFMVSEIQIDRAQHAGATIILLIVAALEKQQLKRLNDYALSKGLEVLIEVHDEQELQIALELDAKLIGINNRNLKTFEVSIERTAQLAKNFPFDEGRVLISESGMQTKEDAQFAYANGASGILVGEALMRSENPGNWIRQATSEEAVK